MEDGTNVFTDELEFNEEAEILFDLFCEELNTRKRLEAADGVKITQEQWSFLLFIVVTSMSSVSVRILSRV